MTKNHGNKTAMQGNTNAQKSDNAADAKINIRLSKELKALWLSEADKQQMKLTDYIKSRMPTIE